MAEPLARRENKPITKTGAAEEPRAGGALSFVSGATGPLMGLVLLCVFLSFTTDTFLSVRNLLNVMDQITVLGVMAIGMTLVILIGGIDLSVGSVLALSGMVMGYLGDNRGWPFVIAIVVALVVSAACGLVSGLMVTRLSMPAFIATLAMMSIARGVASIRGLTQAHYNASKAGVIHLSKSLAMEWVSRGVRVNVISPGYTLTPMNKRPEVAEQLKAFAAETPMARIATVEEMAGPAIFLSSPAASFMTGVDLLVDGGFECW
jgi:NAD(P)-dependent dehydrogenase (short-subunit alcohol dehydrogenase family)